MRTETKSHPYDAIVLHKEDVFGNGIDDLVRELHGMPGFSGLRKEVRELLETAATEPEAVVRRLTEMREQLSRLRRG